MSISQNNARTIKNQGESVNFPKDKGKYSLHINIGWTFSNDPKNLPSGQYTLRITGKDKNSTITQTVHDGRNNRFDNGKIVIDRALKCLTGEGELIIKLTDGTTYQAKVKLGGLPNIATPDGLARRLTNLGFYAGTETKGKCNPRMAWAIRAFKRMKMNNFIRNKNEVENSRATKKFLLAVQAAFGAHPDDKITKDLDLTQVSTPVSYCGMFGKHVFRRGSFETKDQKDDIDQGPGQTGIWEGVSAVDKTKEPKDYEPIAGDYTIYLRAFDPNEPKTDPNTGKKITFTKIEPFSNRINLPQPIHMAQFVLFELGYWLVGGETKDTDWVTVGTTQTRNRFIPNGKFERYTQWAVREFQCHAKFPYAAKEDVASKEQLYMRRVFQATQNSPPKLAGEACYPKDGKVSGALNEVTRKALQAWADGALRCPVIVYSSTDNKNKTTGNGTNLDLVLRENLWLYNDHPSTNPRMYAIDYSGYYTIPDAYKGQVTWEIAKDTKQGGEKIKYSFPKPIVVGDYATYNPDSGPRSVAPYHSWAAVEITPETMLGKGGNNGAGLTDKELALFKVIRAAANFECYGFFDILNAYDNVTISFGPCHWTLATCSGVKAKANERREMPAFLAYVRQTYTDCYKKFFGSFGLFPERQWDEITMDKGSGTYSDRIKIQTENKDNVILCGVSGTESERFEDNKYAKNWHSFYRFQMACRTSSDLQRAMWDFTKIRIYDILNKSFTIDGEERRVGDYVTSEKGVAMLLRWHIRWPGHLFRVNTERNPNYILNILTEVISSNSKKTQTREDQILLKLSEIGGPKTDGHLTQIYNSTSILMNGTKSYSHLNVSGLSSELDSFRKKVEGE